MFNYFTQRSQRGKGRQGRHVERQRNISYFVSFTTIRRSFAHAQDDASEMCGAGKAERAERSGLPVMLSVSETSHFAKPSP
jgi:hypothetical protein